jgi:hypothetical protein
MNVTPPRKPTMIFLHVSPGCVFFSRFLLLLKYSFRAERAMVARVRERIVKEAVPPLTCISALELGLAFLSLLRIY